MRQKTAGTRKISAAKAMPSKKALLHLVPGKNEPPSKKNTDTKLHLQQTQTLFLQAFLLSLQTGKSLHLDLEEIEISKEYVGVLYEGTAMGLAVMDQLTPWKRNRWSSFIADEGAKHKFASYVAYGMALSYVKQPAMERFSSLEPLWQWLVVDGYGFHQAYSQPHRYIHKREIPAALNNSYGKRAFIQGVGRCLWFMESGQIRSIAKTISTFDPGDHMDLWSGLGVACAYAGGVDATQLKKLKLLAGEFKSALRQGIAFAAMVRQRADNPAEQTELACQTICRLSAHEAANLAESSLINLPPDQLEPAYEIWRQRIQNYFS